MYILDVLGLITSCLFIWLIPHGLAIFLVGFIIFVVAARWVPYASTLFMAPVWPFTLFWFFILGPILSKILPSHMSSGKRHELAQAEYERLLKGRDLNRKLVERFMKKWPEFAAWALWDEVEDPAESVDYDRRGRDLDAITRRPHELSEQFLSLMEKQAEDMEKWGEFLKRYPKKYWICEPCSKTKNLIPKTRSWSSPHGVCSHCEIPQGVSLMPMSHFEPLLKID
jgi:hypothetical protein